MIQELKQNIDTEIEILREISNDLRRMDYANSSERKLLLTSIESLKNSMKVINSSIPKIVENISAVNKLPRSEAETSLERVEFKSRGSTIMATVQSKDRERLLKDLSMNDSLIKRLKKKQFLPGEVFNEKKAPRGYLKLSNKFFLNQAQTLLNKGHFKSLSVQLRKANIDVLLATYIAMTFFTTLLSFFVGIFITIFFLFFSLHLSINFITLYNGDFFSRLLMVFWIPLVTPMITFFVLYLYPSTEKDSLAKKIERELPFAVIHMSAISGSGIEPTQIFKIIGLNKEYPYLKKEIRKVLNQINLYGYDLVTSLNNVSKTTPSTKLAELFAGLSTTITSGSNLQGFFEKRSETLLVSYRLEREKYTKVAETFMDIYISIVIAAPMILMILLVMISVLKIQTGLSTNELSFLMISLIGLINGVFIGILHLKQPTY